MSWLQQDSEDHEDSSIPEPHAENHPGRDLPGVRQLHLHLPAVTAKASGDGVKRRQNAPKTSLAILLLLTAVGWAVIHFSVRSIRARSATAVPVPEARVEIPAARPVDVVPSGIARPDAGSPQDSGASHLNLKRVEPEKSASTTPPNVAGTSAAARKDAVTTNSSNPLNSPNSPNPPKKRTQASGQAGQESAHTITAAKPQAPPVVVPSDAPGDKELRTGKQYLAGDGVGKNSAEGARWLWKAVAARNTSAEMELATLYARGEGVAKNCEQAKILLDSAAKRGVEAAGAQLKQLNDSGCQ